MSEDGEPNETLCSADWFLNEKLAILTQNFGIPMQYY